VPGRELELRIQFRTDVFDADAVEVLIERFTRMLVAMIADPTQRLSTSGLLDAGGHTVAQPSTIDSEHRGPNGEFQAPTTLVEQILAGIYAHVLGVERVGVDESFIDLGGDSLSAMRAIAAINNALGIRLTLTALFDAPSIRSLSQQLTDTPRR
jgi:acyl carrier protein